MFLHSDILPLPMRLSIHLWKGPSLWAWLCWCWVTVELPLLTSDIIKCTGANSAAGLNAQLDQTPVFLLCTTLVDNAIPRDAGGRKDPHPSLPVSCMGFVLIMHASIQHQKSEKNCQNSKHLVTPCFISALGSSWPYLSLWPVAHHWGPWPCGL